MLRVLAISPGGIGDQILLFPTLAGIKATYAQVELDVLAEPRALGAYSLCPSIHKALGFDFKGNLPLGDWVNLIGQIRERNYDGVVSLGRSPGVAFLLWLTGIPTRVGYGGRPLADLLLTNPVILRQDQYAAEMYHDLLAGFGTDLASTLPQVRLRSEDQTWCQKQLKKLDLDPKRLVLLHPGASQLSQQKGIAKVYPAQKWSAVLMELHKAAAQLQLVVIAGPDDQQSLSILQGQLGDLVQFIIPPDVGKLAALINQSALLLCVDSAPMHLGVATGRPLVALFGPTNPQRLLPSDPRFVALQNPNVEGIAIQQIVQAATKLLGSAMVKS